MSEGLPFLISQPPPYPKDTTPICFFLRVSDPWLEEMPEGVVGHRAVQWFHRVHIVGPGAPSLPFPEHAGEQLTPLGD